jgi:hypothetical protein
MQVEMFLTGLNSFGKTVARYRVSGTAMAAIPELAKEMLNGYETVVRVIVDIAIPTEHGEVVKLPD